MTAAAVLFFLSTVLTAQKGSFSSSSMLSSGKWLKVALTSEGIYRIDYTALRQRGFADPVNPRVYGNNTGQLSFFNESGAPDDLREIAIHVSTGSDGVFNEGDYILFYAQGTHRWKFNNSTREYFFSRHHYSDTAFYFITSSPGGARVTAATEPAQSPAYSTSSSDALFIHETEKENLIKSGRDWFEPVPQQGIRVNPGFNNLASSEKINFRISVAARAAVKTGLSLLEGTTVRSDIVVQSVNLYNTTGTFAALADSSGSFVPLSQSPSFDVKYDNKGEQGARGWLDFLTLQARTENIFSMAPVILRDARSVGAGNITAFSLQSTVTNPVIWDITDPFRVKSIIHTRNGANLTFKSRTDSLRTFIVFTPDKAMAPYLRPALVPNQDLHGSGEADMVILTHPLFEQYAEKLAAIHLANSGLSCQIVTPSEVYNEFSGGVPDIAAIRNFLRMKFQRQQGTSRPLRYLLLFGDGSYENKTLPPKNPNFIPTYQSPNSNIVVSSFTSDDFYGLLEEGEGEAQGSEDIGIGRLPVSDTVQAGIILEKIRSYLDPSNNGAWKNVICLVADDEDGNTHMNDGEGLAGVLNERAPEYNIDKIYLDAFRQVTTVNGQTYPDVNKAINDRINDGCLIFNYVGHGNETGLAHERVVKMEDVNQWRNRGKLPLFITATCEYSRFDDVEVNPATRELTPKTSAGESVLLRKEGGAVALMSTTRVVYSAPNFFLNRDIYNYAFDSDSSGNPMRLGDIIKLAKNSSGNSVNKRNFSLLGDPALRLAYPWHGRVVTDSINNIPAGQGTDSLKALSLITVSGHIEDNKGRLLNNFNGKVSPLIYDKENRIRTIANDGGPVMEFYLRNNILFSGNTIAANGRFRFSFIVPRDINYSFGNGKISYYAHDDESDMTGSTTDIVVGGFSGEAVSDTKGPEIRLYMNDTLFRDGGMTSSSPVLIAVIEDKGGINTSGSGIGHDITGFPDGQRNSSVVLNSYFVNDIDNYSKGRVTYSLSSLEKGRHSFTVKAWDNFNNSSEETIHFMVGPDEKFVLTDLFNYPNPFSAETKITGQLNRPGTVCDAGIRIFSLDGKLIREIRTTIPVNGFVLPPVTWDGTDESGNRVAKGMYMYVVTLTTGDGETCRASGRMIIL